ncbi:MAG: lipoate--protein ligase [Clostridiales bacterium]|nr:lipoate--protein ligase [Clostridiales bacterium]
MIDNIKYIISNQNNPYKNLALEEYLLKNVLENQCILYLWQNEKTVVIGKNQNPWKECKIEALTEDGGSLARRLSGGGAVFHDLGNLNFTFLVRKDNYDVEKQLQVILNAVKSLGIPAEKSGRNDITVEGRKFSGNAFYSDGINNYHHGTILVNVDMSMLSHYLKVSKAKLESKGVNSVRSRVVNLKEYRPDLDIDLMKKELIDAFGQVYSLIPEALDERDISLKDKDKLEEKFSSWEWKYGRRLKFSSSYEERFLWGNIEIQYLVDKGVIKDCGIYSDSLNIEFFEGIALNLIGSNYTAQGIINTINDMPVDEETELIRRDIIQMIKEHQQ